MSLIIHDVGIDANNFRDNNRPRQDLVFLFPSNSHKTLILFSHSPTLPLIFTWTQTQYIHIKQQSKIPNQKKYLSNSKSTTHFFSLPPQKISQTPNPNPMELSRLSISFSDKRFFSPPIRNSSSSPHPLPPPLSSFFTLSLCNNHRTLRRKSYCSASNSDTLLGEAVVVSNSGKKEEEQGDLKSWMHKHGLPPCKVVLKEKPSHDNTHKPIHYVAASEDLQVQENKSLFFFFF